MIVCVDCGAAPGEWHDADCPQWNRGFAELTKPDPVEDIVSKPDHYARWAIEPKTFIIRNGFEFWRGNIVKYASRAGYKLYPGQDEVQSEITDLKKVIRYAEMRINQLQGEPDL